MVSIILNWQKRIQSIASPDFIRGLLAQEELLAVEHPGLYHLKTAIQSAPLSRLQGDESLLIDGVKRRVILGIDRPVSNGGGLYRNAFALAGTEQIDQCLEIPTDPSASKIFCVAAPSIRGRMGQPYERADLENFFYRAFNAFWSVKEQSNGHRVVIHTGNWEASRNFSFTAAGCSSRCRCR